jgi:hypothetical protein
MDTNHMAATVAKLIVCNMAVIEKSIQNGNIIFASVEWVRDPSNGGESLARRFLSVCS